MKGIQAGGCTPPTNKKITLVVAEDEILLADVLPRLLHAASSGEIEVVQTCLNRFQLFRTLRETTPDVLLCDVWMPKNSGDQAMPYDVPSLKALRRQSPSTAILLFSGKWDAALAKNLLDSEANGLLNKGIVPEQICQVIKQVKQGKRYIMPHLQTEIDALNIYSSKPIRDQLLAGRRGDVLRLLLEGFSPREIADLLPVGKKHVDKKIAEIKAILGVNTHIRILRACIKLGIIKV